MFFLISTALTVLFIYCTKTAGVISLEETNQKNASKLFSSMNSFTPEGLVACGIVGGTIGLVSSLYNIFA